MGGHFPSTDSIRKECPWHGSTLTTRCTRTRSRAWQGWKRWGYGYTGCGAGSAARSIGVPTTSVLSPMCLSAEWHRSSWRWPGVAVEQVVDITSRARGRCSGRSRKGVVFRSELLDGEIWVMCDLSCSGEGFCLRTRQEVARIPNLRIPHMGRNPPATYAEHLSQAVSNLPDRTIRVRQPVLHGGHLRTHSPQLSLPLSTNQVLICQYSTYQPATDAHKSTT